MSLHAWFLGELAMYAAYHRDRRNRLTHHIGVPLIVFALLLAFNQVHVADVAAHVTLGQLLLGALMALYLIAAPLVGVLACAFYALVYAIVLHTPAALTWPLAAAAFVIGWALKFLGHAFEGRRPAVFVNVTQVFIAPAFLIAEGLFACGLARTLAADLDGRASKQGPR